jgi:hypothetical protein
MAMPSQFTPLAVPKTATNSELTTAAAASTSTGNLLGFSIDSAPVNGVDAVHLLTITGDPTGGTVTIGYGGVFCSPISLATLIGTQATAEAAVKAALEGLSTFYGLTATVVRSGSTPNFVFTVTYGGEFAGMPIAVLEKTNALTGGTTPNITPSSSVTGISGTERGRAGKAAILQRTDTGKLYVNGGTINKPDWKLVTSA